jgi:mRNA guanylyltransferase
MTSEGPIQSIGEPGVRATGNVLFTMRQEVAQLLGRTQRSFPGAQPVSFASHHLEELRKEE